MVRHQSRNFAVRKPDLAKVALSSSATVPQHRRDDDNDQACAGDAQRHPSRVVRLFGSLQSAKSIYLRMNGLKEEQSTHNVTRDLRIV